MRRLIPAITVVLLATACGSGVAHSNRVSVAAPTPTASATAALSVTPSTPNTATSAASAGASGQLTTVIPASQLPYKPAAGAPALDDVSIIKTAADSCGIPADDSGNEAQLINAQLDVTVLITTFEVSNPCQTPLSYDIAVTQAIGSATGPSGGPATQATTPVIQPGASVSFNVNVDPSASLTPTQLQKLWVGVTRITKHKAG